MASQFRTDIDLNGNELLQARLENLASAPSPSVGRCYFNTTDNTAYCWNGAEWKDMLFSGSSANFDDVMHFGESGSIDNKFIKSSLTNHTSLDSTFVAPFAGQVVNATISTEKDPLNNFFVQVIKGAIKGVGSSPFYGGAQIGTDLEKTSGATNSFLDKVYTNLTGYTFSAGDRIAVYIKKGTLGNMDATEPAISLYVKYD